MSLAENVLLFWFLFWGIVTTFFLIYFLIVSIEYWWEKRHAPKVPTVEKLAVEHARYIYQFCNWAECPMPKPHKRLEHGTWIAGKKTD